MGSFEEDIEQFFCQDGNSTIPCKPTPTLYDKFNLYLKSIDFVNNSNNKTTFPIFISDAAKLILREYFLNKITQNYDLNLIEQRDLLSLDQSLAIDYFEIKLKDEFEEYRKNKIKPSQFVKFNSVFYTLKSTNDSINILQDLVKDFFRPYSNQFNANQQILNISLGLSKKANYIDKLEPFLQQNISNLITYKNDDNTIEYSNRELLMGIENSPLELSRKLFIHPFFVFIIYLIQEDVVMNESEKLYLKEFFIKVCLIHELIHLHTNIWDRLYLNISLYALKDWGIKDIKDNYLKEIINYLGTYYFIIENHSYLKFNYLDKFIKHEQDNQNEFEEDYLFGPFITFNPFKNHLHLRVMVSLFEGSNYLIPEFCISDSSDKAIEFFIQKIRILYKAIVSNSRYANITFLDIEQNKLLEIFELFAANYCQICTGNYEDLFTGLMDRFKKEIKEDKIKTEVKKEFDRYYLTSLLFLQIIINYFVHQDSKTSFIGKFIKVFNHYNIERIRE